MFLHFSPPINARETQRLSLAPLPFTTTTLPRPRSFFAETHNTHLPHCPLARGALTTTTTTFVGVSSSLGPSRPWKSASSYPLASRSASAAPPRSHPLSSMSDDKKTDDLNIELGERSQTSSAYASRRNSPAPPMANSNGLNLNSPVLAILSYCGSSILMTVSNKYCVSGTGWNLTFFLLAVQV